MKSLTRRRHRWFDLQEHENCVFYHGAALNEPNEWRYRSSVMKKRRKKITEKFSLTRERGGKKLLQQGRKTSTKIDFSPWNGIKTFQFTSAVARVLDSQGKKKKITQNLANVVCGRLSESVEKNRIFIALPLRLWEMQFGSTVDRRPSTLFWSLSAVSSQHSIHSFHLRSRTIVWGHIQTDFFGFCNFCDLRLILQLPISESSSSMAECATKRQTTIELKSNEFFIVLKFNSIFHLTSAALSRLFHLQVMQKCCYHAALLIFPCEVNERRVQRLPLNRGELWMQKKNPNW